MKKKNIDAAVPHQQYSTPLFSDIDILIISIYVCILGWIQLHHLLPILDIERPHHKKEMSIEKGNLLGFHFEIFIFLMHIISLNRINFETLRKKILFYIYFLES